MTEIETIEGILSESRYKFEKNHCLKKISFKQGRLQSISVEWINT